MRFAICIILASLALSAHAEGFGTHKSSLVWYGEKYTLTISDELLDASQVTWDGLTPVPLGIGEALEATRPWMKTNNLDRGYRLSGMTLFFFADRKDEAKGVWAYMVHYSNGKKELVADTRAYRRDMLTFYVLMDGTVISPKEEQNK